jgi:hypothetical protein
VAGRDLWKSDAAQKQWLVSSGWWLVKRCSARQRRYGEAEAGGECRRWLPFRNERSRPAIGFELRLHS